MSTYMQCFVFQSFKKVPLPRVRVFRRVRLGLEQFRDQFRIIDCTYFLFSTFADSVVIMYKRYIQWKRGSGEHVLFVCHFIPSPYPRITLLTYSTFTRHHTHKNNANMFISVRNHAYRNMTSTRNPYRIFILTNISLSLIVFISVCH